MADRARALVTALSLSAALISPATVVAQSSYQLFESGPVRPVALSPNGLKLFVANTPDGHLEIFDVSASGTLTPSASVPVGLEPVAVAARDDGQVWVVNHLSDSVSIVDVASSPPRVVRTLLVGDEPRDIAFAGSPRRAFISTAHRGQHRTHSSIATVVGAGDPELTIEGKGRADVWVFNASSPGSAVGGLPDRILTFFADTPRALATDGTNVYLAAFHSGNQTTALLEPVVPNSFVSGCGGSGQGLGLPGPSTNAAGNPAPHTGLIVKFNSATSNWVDPLGCTWNSSVMFNLPDHDVFAVNANTLAAGAVFDRVGTILFNMAVNPQTGKVYVTNTESPNQVRFEGPGDFAGSTVQGHLSESRVSVLDPAGPSVNPQHLNRHIAYGNLHTDLGANHSAIDAQIPHSLATPLQVVVSDDLGDQKVYVAAFGSAKIGVFDASVLESASFEAIFDPTVASARYIPTGGGPAGLALNDANDRLYVLTRFDQKIAVYRVGGPTSQFVQSIRLASPEPASVIEGRPVLYDAVATSGNGEASCASCHIFGDFDGLAWDLGNPDDVVTANPQPQIGGGPSPAFHPMKGPMTTQTLRGLATHGALHWRGDRSNGFFGQDPCDGSPNSNAPCDEALSFDNFIVAFEGLVGNNGLIPTAEMQKFTDFILQLRQPPNPVANIDGSQTPEQAAGESVYTTVPSDAGAVPCVVCHALSASSGFFGTGGAQSNEGETQRFKIAHLRNAYQKIGMFGLPGVTGHLGDQVRGFGFLHDGGIDTLKHFVGANVFSLNDAQEDQLVAFMHAFPSDLAPVVGQQVSIGPGSPGSFASSDVNGRITALAQRAAAAFDSFVLGGTVTECDLVAKTVEAGAPRSYQRLASGSFLPDDGGPAITEAALRAKANPAGSAQDISYLCAPPGSGQRIGIDRDQDSMLNGADNCPAWPNGPALGTCTAGDPELRAAHCTSSSQCGTGGVCSLAQENTDGDGLGDACELAVLPEPGASVALAIGAGLLGGLRLRRSGRVSARCEGRERVAATPCCVRPTASPAFQ